MLIFRSLQQITCVNVTPSIVSGDGLHTLSQPCVPTDRDCTKHLGTWRWDGTVFRYCLQSHVDLSWLYFSVSLALPLVQNRILLSLDVPVRDHPVDRPCLWYDMVRCDSQCFYWLFAIQIVANLQCFHPTYLCAFVQMALPFPPSYIILGTTVVRRQINQFSWIHIFDISVCCHCEFAIIRNLHAGIWPWHRFISHATSFTGWLLRQRAAAWSTCRLQIGPHRSNRSTMHPSRTEKLDLGATTYN